MNIPTTQVPPGWDYIVNNLVLILVGAATPNERKSCSFFRDKQMNPVPILKLIDFGRAIDLKSHPANVVFMQKTRTDSFECTQMTKNQPWNYHVS